MELIKLHEIAIGKSLFLPLPTHQILRKRELSHLIGISLSYHSFLYSLETLK